MERKYLTVSALNRYLKYKFEHDENLQDILLKAEISNFKKHSRGHLYLTLKDDNSQISAVMFAGNTRALNFIPKDGDKVIVEGHISVYEPYGTYQVYINKMDLDGIGDLYLAYEKLKQDLQKQGLFAEEHKQAIPKYPEVVGVITSPTGAAVRDVINVISLRYPLAKIIVYPALVQGVNAKESVADQINQANRDQLVDVLIVGRGGGSIEDLWAFNEEIVARAIYASKIPIVSAVGHETDFTIADFVSDQRASTPSHAAELAVPSKKDIFKLLSNYQERMQVSLAKSLEAAKKHYLQLSKSGIMRNPEKLLEASKLKLLYLEDKLNAYKPSNQIKNYQENIDNYLHRFDQRIKAILKDNSNYLNNYIQRSHLGIKSVLKDQINHFLNVSQKLELVNPLSIMKKGFTVVKQDERLLKSVNEVDLDKDLAVEFHDGSLSCKINEKVVK